jgi:hypothetical protein
MSRADIMVRNETHTIGNSKKPVQVLSCTEKKCKTRLTTIKATTPEAVIAQARAKGWNINMSNKSAICPNHSEVREMPVDQKRRIWREIDDNYEAKRYVPGITDKILGEKLNVPWAWVKDIREADFGPEGSDPEIAKMNTRIKEAETKINEVESLAFRCAEAAEKLRNDVVFLQAQMTTLLKK